MSKKILFFGLGSIGQRHARLIRKRFNHTLFAYKSNNKSILHELSIKNVSSLKEIQTIKPDIGFITNPTNLHIETAILCAQNNMHLFIEKPIDSSIDNLDKLVQLVKKRNLTTYIAYNLRFSPVIQELQKLTSMIHPYHIRVVCSSYLPNWRKKTDHLQSYSSYKKMGGGVLLDLSHDLDYLSYITQCNIRCISSHIAKQATVTNDSEDFADLFFKISNFYANVHLNIFSNNTQRQVYIDSKEISIIGDLIDNTIKTSSQGKVTDLIKYSETNDSIYMKQLEYFFSNINNPSIMNNIEEASTLFSEIIKIRNYEYEN